MYEEDSVYHDPLIMRTLNPFQSQLFATSTKLKLCARMLGNKQKEFWLQFPYPCKTSQLNQPNYGLLHKCSDEPITKPKQMLNRVCFCLNMNLPESSMSAAWVRNMFMCFQAERERDDGQVAPWTKTLCAWLKEMKPKCDMEVKNSNS